VNLKIFWM